MKVYKFGGASVKNAEGVNNLVHIVLTESEPLVVVVSAMGKTTNALERIVNAAFAKDCETLQREKSALQTQHFQIAQDLFPVGYALAQNKLRPFFETLDRLTDAMLDSTDARTNAFYDYYYDQIVSLGELMSTTLVFVALNRAGKNACWLDMTRLLMTDDTYREAKINFDLSACRVQDAFQQSKADCYVVQGFIGGTVEGARTTLGREGSDYSAAVLAHILDAQSVTIWKDVPGILNADPRLVADTTLIPELTYYDAVELAYSGAQIIHPKTIRPLQNKQIPLYVRPFASPEQAGSVIHASTAHPIDVPVLIWRKNQVLITVRPKDFSFVLEDCLNEVFEIIHRHRLKVSLIQSSAVTISVCVDQSRYLQEAIACLQQAYAVSFNENLSLLTIRGTTPQIIERYTSNAQILLSQTTRRTARFVML